MLLYRYNCPRLIYKNSFWFQFQGHIVSMVVQISIPLLEIIKNLFLYKKHINHITKSNACVNIKHLKLLSAYFKRPSVYMRDMPESQQCPWNFNLIIIWRTMSFSWFQKRFFINSVASNFCRKHKNENSYSGQKHGYLLSNSYLISCNVFRVPL